MLLQVGADRPRNPAQGSTLTNPLTLSDVYFRVGGPHIGKAEVSLQIDADNVLVDHTWVWRADHGVEGFTGPNEGDSQRWATNTGRNGVIVNGDDVTATGLFVEHYQEHNTIWNGERGKVVLYQNELPYDPPSQADWTQPDGTLGYPGLQGRRRREPPTSCGAAGPTCSTATTRASSPRTASRFPTPRACR